MMEFYDKDLFLGFTRSVLEEKTENILRQRDIYYTHTLIIMMNMMHRYIDYIRLNEMTKIDIMIKVK